MRSIFRFAGPMCFLIIFSCDKENAVFHPDGSAPVVSLNPGNAYSIHFNEYGRAVVHEWSHLEEITGDTLIRHTPYVIIDDGRIIRADDRNMYAFSNGRETIRLKYDVRKGDVVPFLGQRAVVTGIVRQDVFGVTQTVIHVANALLHPDTVVTGKYATFFGMLSYSETYGQRGSGWVLSGALIDGVQYGSMEPAHP